jgi:hypothetical protein
MMMIGYKLFTLHKDGSIGPLFINKKQRLQVGKEYDAEEHKTKGFAFRPGWHVCATKSAPHLKKEGRIWARVQIKDVTEHVRPSSQGGLWYTANKLRILELLTN